MTIQELINKTNEFGKKNKINQIDAETKRNLDIDRNERKIKTISRSINDIVKLYETCLTNNVPVSSFSNYGDNLKPIRFDTLEKYEKYTANKIAKDKHGLVVNNFMAIVPINSTDVTIIYRLEENEKDKKEPKLTALNKFLNNYDSFVENFKAFVENAIS